MNSDVHLNRDSVSVSEDTMREPGVQSKPIVPSVFAWQKSDQEFILISQFDALNYRYNETQIGKTANELFRHSPEILTDLDLCYGSKFPIKKQGTDYLCCTDQKKELMTTYIFSPPNIVNMCIEDVTLHKQAHKMLRSTRTQLAIDARKRTSELLRINRKLTNEIIQHQLATDELRLQTKRNQTLLQNSPDGLWVVDLAGQLCEVNEAYCSMSGYTTPELLSMNVSQIDANESEAEVKSRIRKILDNNTDCFETRHLKKNGESIDVEIKVSLVYLDKKPYFFAFIRDITERKIAEYAIKEKEKIMRLIADNLPVLISYVDRNLCFRFNNEAYREWFKLDPKKILNQPIKKILGEAIYKHSLEYYKQVLSGLCASYETQQTYPDGKTRCVSIIHVPDIDSNQNVKGFVTLVNDISARKFLEEKSRQHQQDLAHVSRISTVNELTTGLAHEINQPLAAISNYCKAGLHWLKNANTEPEEYQHLLEKVIAQAERASGIIHNIRQLLTKKQLQRKPTDINQLIKNSIELLGHNISQCKLKVRCELVNNLPLANVDSIQIQQVILNLLKNGIEAMCKEDSCVSGELVIRTQLDDAEYINIAVSDNGPSLPDGDIDRIFQSFYTTKSDGLGLGLSVSRSIVEAHSGKLWAEANSSKGLTFHFLLKAH